MMNLDELRLILEMVREHELAEFELEQEGVKLRLRKHADPVPAASAPRSVPAAAPPAAAAAGAAHAVAAPDAVSASAGGEDEDGLELAVVTAPIVGTFYRAPSPDAAAFVEIGSKVKQGQALCIIEAMKLMNEIESEYDGEIVRVFVENGQPVQYGERLFAVKRG
jgi:acetyl-CoA carboxylase biotin carboxyl carrier protein